MSINQPRFEDFESSSSSRRKLANHLFFLMCVIVATLSVVILGVLLTSIFLSAMPTFGPHADHMTGVNRMVVVQSESSAADKVDVGDVVQGLFPINSLQRGGLGKANDETFATDENKSFSKVGLYSFEVAEKIRVTDLDVLFHLRPATGRNSLASLLKSASIDIALDENSCLAVLDNTAKSFDLDEFNAVGSGLLDNNKIANQLDGSSDWKLLMSAGVSGEQDFMELKLNSDQIDKIDSLRGKKKGGQLNGVISITKFLETDQFKNVRVRSFETSELVSGQLKIDSEFLRGINAADKNGFQLGGELDLIYCPLSDKTVSVWRNVVYFLGETTKSESPGAGIGPAIQGSVWVIIFCALFALPIGVGTAIFLEEFKPTNKFLLILHSMIQLNISNLAGVPSIVYGILGLTAFAWMFGLFGSVKEPGFQFGATHFYQYVTEGDQVILIPVDDPDAPPTLTNGMSAQDTEGNPVELNIIGEDDDFPDDDSILGRSLLHDAEGGLYSDKSWYYFQLPFGRGVLAASLTLMLVILPVIIIATQEALRAVPSSLREGALGLGSTPWQVVRKVTLPAAIPSIMTGAILSMSRAIGEAAPVLILCGIVYVTAGPQHLMDTYSVLPIQIYFWTGEPVDRSLLINFQNVAAAGIVVLLFILLSFNAVAILIRQFTQKPLS